MPRSSTSRCCALAIALYLAIHTGDLAAQILGSAAGRFVDIIELTDHDDQADIAIQFNCSMRYVTHLPTSEGTELRIQLQALPDCGVNPLSQIPGELPPVSGGDRIIAAARVESDIPGQITLLLSWKKTERFVIAQGSDLHGIRVRLIDRARGRGKIILSEPIDPVRDFAINLESQPKPFEPAAIELASQRMKMPAYVSEAVVDEQRWYRLRVGPIERQSDATRILNSALADYPRAWLAIGDDSATTDTSTPDSALPTTVERIGSDPPLDPATLKQLLAQTRAALGARDYPGAIRTLTKLQRQPEFPGRSEAQELLGLAQERSGQLAQAKAEYEEYLRRYPQGTAAARVADRLRVLRTAAANARTSQASGVSELGWHLTGSVGQLFRYDGTTINSNIAQNTGSVATTSASSSASNSEDALYNDVELLARRHGERFNLVGRLSAGYTQDFSGATGNARQLSLASLDISDTTLGLLVRAGRQTRNQDGVLGTFDGVLLAYQWRPAWSINVAAGYPVEQTRDGLQTRRRFEALALALTPPGRAWDVSAFVAEQQFDGLRDRQAVGLDARYLISRLSLAAILDYDTFYRSLNAAALLGTLQLPARWNLSFDAEKRNAPVLTTRNALIGQPETSIAQLEQIFTEPEIFQLARDRTPVSENFAITATRPLGERYQFATTVAATSLGATVASGGIDAQPGTGLQMSYQMQIYGSGLWSRGDFNILSLTHANTEVGLLDSIGITSRFPVAGAWRLGPRFSVNRRIVSTDNSRELTYLPSMLLDYQRTRTLLQFELGGELGSRDASLQSQTTHRYYISLAYRIAF